MLVDTTRETLDILTHCAYGLCCVSGGSSAMVGYIEKHIGRRIAERRKVLGLGQTTVAECLGVPRQLISKYESGIRKLSAAELVSIARTLKVSVGYLFEGLPDSVSSDRREALADALSALPEELIDTHLALLRVTAARIQNRVYDSPHLAEAGGPV